VPVADCGFARPEFEVISCPLDPDVILKTAGYAGGNLNADDARSGVLHLSVVPQMYLAHAEIAQILLLERYSPEAVVNAFRSGARGYFVFRSILFACRASVFK